MTNLFGILSYKTKFYKPNIINLNLLIILIIITIISFINSPAMNPVDLVDDKKLEKELFRKELELKLDAQARIEEIIKADLSTSESEIASFNNWPENICEISIPKEYYAFFEIVNRSLTDIWVAILNRPNFFVPIKILGSYTNMNYDARATIIDTHSPVYIYIWVQAPEKVIRNSRVQMADLIYKISPGLKTNLFFSWNKTLTPQTGGGYFGINNILGVDPQARKSYLLQKEFSLENNISLGDIELLKDSKRDDFNL